MKESTSLLVQQLVEMFMKMTRSDVHQCICLKELTRNENLVLFMLDELAQQDKVSLCVLRERMRLAPSTVTPIVASLEKQGLIKRNIDTNDRRNIYLQITPKGKEFTIKSCANLTQEMEKYIEFMGEEDINILMHLISKTSIYFKERKNER